LFTCQEDSTDVKKKAFFTYAVLLALVFTSHAFHLRFLDYHVPFYLLAVPLVLKRRININFSVRHILLGLLVSLIILLPFLAVFFPEKKFAPIGLGAALFQLLGISFPEEVFFRGFLQDVFGNDLKGAVMVSLLFAVAHLPGIFFYGDFYAPLTFFPSLVMGFLYMRTSNVVPSTIFHFLSNVVYFGAL
jgi:membrane protease YdiL (CAAX protease family)